MPTCPTSAEDVKRSLLKVPMVKKVDSDRQAGQEASTWSSRNERLAALGITPLAIAESLNNQNAMLPAARSTPHRPRDGARDRPVRQPGRHPQRARSRPAAASIKLGDIATVTRGYEDPPTYTVRHNGQQVLMLGIVMTDDGNIVELGKAMERRWRRSSPSCRTAWSWSASPTSPRS